MLGVNTRNAQDSKEAKCIDTQLSKYLTKLGWALFNI
jgi:hypothetical protein